LSLLFSRLFLSKNLSFVFSSAIIIFSTVRLNSSLFLGFSLQKSWNYHLAMILWEKASITSRLACTWACNSPKHW
jgi:hypothetical protein